MNKKICIEVKQSEINKQGIIRIDNEAAAIVTSLATKSGWSNKKIASTIIKRAMELHLIELKEG